MSSAVGVAGLKAGEAVSSVDISVCTRPSQTAEAGGRNRRGTLYPAHIIRVLWLVGCSSVGSPKNAPLLFGIVF